MKLLRTQSGLLQQYGLCSAFVISISTASSLDQPFMNWVDRTPPPIVPGPLSASAMAYDIAHRVTVLTTSSPPDTWEWDGSTWKHRAVSSPDPRYGALAYDSHHQTTLMIGNGLSGWDGTNWRTLATGGPALSGGGCTIAMTYDSARSVAVAFKMCTDSISRASIASTWEWDGDLWTLRATTPDSGPTPARGFEVGYGAIAYDSARNVSVLFGGAYLNPAGPGTYYLGDTWEWDGGTWTQRATTGPSPRTSHMVFDSVRRVTVLFGGAVFRGPGEPQEALGDTWEWDGTRWTQRATTGPAPGNWPMAYDITRGVTVLLASGRTWELQPGLFFFVDWRNSTGAQDGSQTRPFGTVRQAANASLTDTTISIQAGDYAESPVSYTQPALLSAANGTVHIH